MNTQNITPLVGPVWFRLCLEDTREGGRGCKLLRHLPEVVGRQQAGPSV